MAQICEQDTHFISDFFGYCLLSWQVSLPMIPCCLRGALGLRVSPLYLARKNIFYFWTIKESLVFHMVGRPWWNLCSSLETGVQLSAPIWMEIDSPPSPLYWRPKSVSFIQWIILFQLFLVAPTLTSLLLLWNIWRSILRFLEFLLVCICNISYRVPLCLYGNDFLYLY